MFYALAQYFWPELTDDEVKKFGILGAIFFLIIGSYWILRITRDTIFVTVAFPEALGWGFAQGAHYQPTARIISVFFIAFSLGIYSKLVDMFSRHQLFYILCSFYSLLFFVFSIVFTMHALQGSGFFSWQVLSIFGWITYFSIESAGSLLIALFWSYAVSITNTGTAKVGFPLILAGGQLGALAGSSMSLFLSKRIVVGFFFVPVMVGLLVVMALVYYLRHFVIEYQPSVLSAQPLNITVAEPLIISEKKSIGFWSNFAEGLRLVVTKSYLAGVLVISTVYEVIAVIVEYQMNRQAIMVPEYATSDGYARFQSLFGMATNTVSLVIVLFGTTFLMKKYGLRICLMIYPVGIGLLLSSLYFFHWLQFSSHFFLWALFITMVMIKGLNFAVNEPTKHIMYIPTSKDVQFKAKGWIDTFGGRFSKMGGAQVTHFFRYNLAGLIQYGTLLSLVLVVFGMAAAFYVGKKNQELTDNQEVIQ